MLLDTLWITVNLCNSTKEAIHLHIMHLWRCEAAYRYSTMKTILVFYSLLSTNPYFASPYRVAYFIMARINPAYRRREKEEGKRKRKRANGARLQT